MNSNWYLYRNFIRPVLVKAAAVLFTACILSTLYWTIYHILNTKGNLLAAISGCALGGVLGCLIGFLLVFTWESIRAMMRIHRIHRFVETFPTVTEACFAYGEEEPVEDLCIVFTRETVERAARKTGFYAG